MDVNINLNKNFVAAKNRMEKKYGEEFLRLQGLSNEQLNNSLFIDNFTADNKKLVDISINPTANMTHKSITTMLNSMSEPQMKLLAFNKLFYEITKKEGRDKANEITEELWNGALYLHDFPTATFLPYCWAMTLQPVAERGLFFIEQFPTGPAKHLTTFMDHVLETVSWMSNLQSGALGLPDLFVYMYYFWWKDVEDNHVLRNPEYYARQYCQKLAYDLNQPYLRITQAAFTNVSFMDREYLIGLFGGREFPDGTPVMDHIDGILQMQKWFVEELTNIRKGDHIFTYPILSYSLLVDKDTHEFVDQETARWASDHNCDWMDGNFFMGTDITSLSSCCRLINDTSKLNAFINSIGGTALQVGSVKVSTINLRRIALESYGDKDEYMRILRLRVKNNLILLDVQRNIIRRNIEKGLLPNYSFGLVELDKQYSTIGISALHTAVEEMGGIYVDEFDNQYYTEDGLAFATQILDEINLLKDTWAESHGYSLNLEQIPGESCNVKLATYDSLLFPDAKKHDIYGNQWIPLHEKCTLQEKFRLATVLDAKCGGGAILHVNVESPFTNKEQAWEVLKAMAKAGVIYSAFNARIRECANHHHWIGHDNCPICGGETTEEYTRIVGFYRPRSSFSKERMAEYDKRTWHNNTNLITD